MTYTSVINENNLRLITFCMYLKKWLPSGLIGIRSSKREREREKREKTCNYFTKNPVHEFFHLFVLCFNFFFIFTSHIIYVILLCICNTIFVPNFESIFGVDCKLLRLYFVDCRLKSIAPVLHEVIIHHSCVHVFIPFQ